ncbi:MAG: CoB--CoM heterodisulfide reductase subunit B [Candidatus Bathyarchaeota archaeon]|nr:MAG: CoB--CoM heterodisulfide reductase subunit B [Candidatus Bathyarchaeota archaeon]
MNKKEPSANESEEAREMRYAFFIGCVTPYRETSYEISTRLVCKKLGIELVELEGANCCGLPIDSMNHESALTLAARDLTLAEDMKLDIMTLCTGCAGALTKTNRHLKEDRESRERINNYLKEIDREFKGTIEVKHLVRVLLEDVGLEKLKDFIKRPLKGLKVAGHHGCHILRPSKYLQFDDPENPSFLQDLIELTGADNVGYIDERDCCGAVAMAANRDVPMHLIRNKILHVIETGASALVTVCPSCHFMFDSNQPIAEKKFSETYNLPVIHYPQMLGLAMGFSPEELAMDGLKVNPEKLLDAIAKTN